MGNLLSQEEALELCKDCIGEEITFRDTSGKFHTGTVVAIDSVSVHFVEGGATTVYEAKVITQINGRDTEHTVSIDSKYKNGMEI